MKGSQTQLCSESQLHSVLGTLVSCMKKENSESALRERTVNQVGADVAVQLMLMMLIACVSRLAEDSENFQTQMRDKLLEITEAVKLPPGTDDIKPEILSAARTVISNVFVGASAIKFPDKPA
jgi:hypothetical protein